MKTGLLLTLFSLACVFSIDAQNKKQKDKVAIKKMCGCYEVGFNFAETFEYSKDSTYTPSQVKHDKGLEWVELLEDQDNKIVMQHLLIVGKPDDQKVIKHWRQDWLYENTDFYMYNSNHSWNYLNFNKTDVKGQWTQKVYQVDDSPRYEGSATWVHVDGKSFWENTTDAPLPRREYTKRQDYNVTVRTNRHEITDYGWVHDQDNNKVIREEGKEDFILAQEKGVNTYKKVDDNKCKAAQDYWETNENKWQIVRQKWDNLFSEKQNISLKIKVDDKPLFKHLFSEDFEFNYDNVSKTIDKYVIK